MFFQTDFNSGHSDNIGKLTKLVFLVLSNLPNNTKKNNLLQKNYPEIEWNKITRVRDFISHHYEMLDYEIVFEIGKK